MEIITEWNRSVSCSKKVRYISGYQGISVLFRDQDIRFGYAGLGLISCLLTDIRGYLPCTLRIWAYIIRQYRNTFHTYPAIFKYARILPVNITCHFIRIHVQLDMSVYYHEISFALVYLYRAVSIRAYIILNYFLQLYARLGLLSCTCA